MPNFAFIYHGGSKPETPEEGAAEMAKWKAWLEGVGEDAVDPGNPVGMSKTVSADGVADNGGSNPTSGYSIIRADDMDAALAVAKECPIVSGGGSVEVAEIIVIDF